MKNKAYIRVITRTKACTLPLNCLIVYSYLVSRAARQRAYSQRHIAAKVGIWRVSLPKIRQSLQDAGLLEVTPAGWRARQPSGQATSWFRRLPHDLWYKSFAFWRLYLPTEACPLSISQRAVLWLLASLKKNKSEKGLATMLHLDPRTVHAAIEKLVSLGLLRRTSGEIRFEFPGDPAWWMDAVGTSTPKDIITLETVLQGKPGTFQTFFQELAAHGYKAAELQEIWSLAQSTEYSETVADLSPLYMAATEQHTKSQASGKYLGQSSAKLFIMKLKAHVEQKNFRFKEAKRYYTA